MGFSRREPAMRVPAVSFPEAGLRQTNFPFVRRG